MKQILIFLLLLTPLFMHAQSMNLEEQGSDSSEARFKSRSDSMAFVIDSMNITALNQYKNGFYRQAEKTADRVIKTDPTITWAYMMRGKCRCNLAEKEMLYTRDFDPSLELFQQCISDLNIYIADRAAVKDHDYKDALDRKREAQKKIRFIKKENRTAQ